MPQTQEITTLLKNLPNDFLETPIGKFKIGPKLGQGGNGIVVSAECGQNRFAIKFLTDSKNQKLARFIDEYLCSSMLPSHPLIVKPIQFGLLTNEEKSYPYIIMNKYDGVLKKLSTPIDSKVLKKIIDDVLDGLNFMHLNGVIHRDIKPQNIFTYKDNYIIGDLGIASFDPEAFSRNAQTKNGERLGNYLFSAPEQIDAIPAHQTMDIYAFGQLIQWLTTGEIHKGTNRKKIDIEIEDYPKLDQVIEACLCHAPAQRPQSILKVKQLLLKKKVIDTDLIRRTNKWKSLQSFNEVIAKSFPKSTTSLVTINSIEISRFLENLSAKIKETDLYWMNSEGGNDHLRRIKKIDGDSAIFLINGNEFKVDKLLIMKNPSIHVNFFILITNGMNPFFENTPIFDTDAAGFWKDGYVTYAELENGFTDINGEIIKMTDPAAEERTRYLTHQALVIAPQASSVNQTKSEAFVVEMLLEAKNNINTFNVAQVNSFTQKFRKNIDRDILYDL